MLCDFGGLALCCRGLNWGSSILRLMPLRISLAWVIALTLVWVSCSKLDLDRTATIIEGFDASPCALIEDSLVVETDDGFLLSFESEPFWSLQFPEGGEQMTLRYYRFDPIYPEEEIHSFYSVGDSKADFINAQGMCVYRYREFLNFDTDGTVIWADETTDVTIHAGHIEVVRWVQSQGIYLTYSFLRNTEPVCNPVEEADVVEMGIEYGEPYVYSIWSVSPWTEEEFTVHLEIVFVDSETAIRFDPLANVSDTLELCAYDGDWPNGLDIGGFEFDYQHYPEIAMTRLSYQSEWWDPVEQQFHIYL